MMLSFSNKIEYGGDKLLKYTTARMRVTLFFPLWLSVAALASALAASGVFLDLAALVKTNTVFNCTLLGLWALGVFLACLPGLRLQREAWWLARGRLERLSLLRPLAVLAQRNPLANRFQITLVLDRCAQNLGFHGVRYVAGALIFVGLVGTLWGLSRTVLEIADVIGTLPTQDISETVFAALKDQLRRPLQGMGMAFSSSLFGVAGSVTLNFILMQVDRAADRFFHASETWALRIFKHADSPLAQTNLGQETPGSERVLQDHLRGLDQLAEALLRTDARHKDLVEATTALGNRLITMTDLMRTQQTTLARWSEEQQSTRHALERMAGRLGESGLASDEAVRTHLAQTAKAVQGLYHHVVVQPKALFPEI
jgi:hypothetical protein